MYRLKLYISIVIILLGVIRSNAQTTLKSLVFKEGKITVIKNVVDMKGGELTLPKNVILKFEKGGRLKNGKVIAANTSISGYKQEIFENVKIDGQWNVPYINTDMFKDILSLNSLQNVFALASDSVDNVITIPEGDYVVEAIRNNQTILGVPSNTEVVVNGTITMLPNNFTNYYIFELKGENIRLHGKGEIIGDKYTHTGTTGEWGMGVLLTSCKNVDVCDITIKDCWGDCIYVGTESTDVRINNCTLIDGRRQGISITSADGIHISNCTISKVRGTAPQYGIDIEPNKGDVVNNILIENVKIYDCHGGILSYGRAECAQIGSIVLKGCKIYDCDAKYPINFQKGISVDVYNCYVDSNDRTAILFQDIENASAKNNSLESKNKIPIKILSCNKKQMIDNYILM